MILQCIRFVSQHFQLHEKDCQNRKHQQQSSTPAALCEDAELKIDSVVKSSTPAALCEGAELKIDSVVKLSNDQNGCNGQNVNICDTDILLNSTIRDVVCKDGGADVLEQLSGDVHDASDIVVSSAAAAATAADMSINTRVSLSNADMITVSFNYSTADMCDKVICIPATSGMLAEAGVCDSKQCDIELLAGGSCTGDDTVHRSSCNTVVQCISDTGNMTADP